MLITQKRGLANHKFFIVLYKFSSWSQKEILYHNLIIIDSFIVFIFILTQS